MNKNLQSTEDISKEAAVLVDDIVDEGTLEDSKTLEETEANDDWYGACSDNKSASPLSRHQDPNMSPSFSSATHSLISNSFPNISPLQPPNITNILDVQRIFAAHMLMIEKQRRLLQTPGEGEHLRPIDLESTEKNGTSIEKSERETQHQECNYDLNKVNRITKQSSTASNSYNRPFQPTFNRRDDEVNSKFLLKHAQCYLETKELWEKFHRLGTEMIITKTGR